MRHRPCAEANRYTTEMWQRHVGEMVDLIHATDGRRAAFIDGFNAADRYVHPSQRAAYDRGRHTAVLLGIPSPDYSGGGS